MSNKRVLIYMKEENIKPTGGPAGYLHNLKYAIEKHENSNIEFIKTKSKVSKYSTVYNRLPLTIKKIYRMFIHLKNCNYILGNNIKQSDINLNEYDIIHFHSTFDMYRVKDSLKDYKGKVLITSHTPKPTHLETMEDSLSSIEKKLFSKKYSKLEIVDEYAFNRADYIIFPCEYAEEPYYNRWKKYDQIKEKNRFKYKYLLSGIKSAKAKLSREEVCEKYGIPKNSFIISYVGRHNETKGYDNLKVIGEKMLKNNTNVYFLIAGSEEPLKGLQHERWIEVGWTNDPHSIIACADVFVLPNKETYFDLIMLEVMSLGKVVLTTNTGGNKYFRDLHLESIRIYNDEFEAIKILQSMANLSKDQIKELGKENKVLFDNEFIVDKFYTKYINLLNEISE